MTFPLSFGWRHLLFANWPVEPRRVTPHLPADLSVQTFRESAWLSVVPLRNVRTRPRGLPGALGLSFPEVNVRTYVTADGEPGVYFFSLDAPSLPSVLGARLTHRLPYFYGSVRLEAADGRVRVESRRRHPGARPGAFVATYEPSGAPFVPDTGSLAGFLTERRRLYAEGQDGARRHTDVFHRPWRLQAVDATVEENTMFRANRFDAPAGTPTCYYSPGVDVWTTGSLPWTGGSQ